jgi:hypothetical protein
MKFLEKLPDEYRPQIECLLDHGGPAIRYRTLRDIIKRPSYCTTLKKARAALDDDPLVRKYLGFLKSGSLGGTLHGSKDFMLENTFGKLSELGMEFGDKRINDTAMHYLKLVQQPYEGAPGFPKSPVIHDWLKRMVVQLLNLMNFQEKFQVDYSLALIDRLAEYIDEGQFDDFYIPYDGFPSPGHYGKMPLVNPKLYDGLSTCVPQVYDLLGFARTKWLRRKKPVLEKVGMIVSFILSPTYQSFERGFGTIYLKEKRSFMAHGWSVEFKPVDGVRPRSQLLVMEALAQFEPAWKNPLFMQELDWLDSFRESDGFWHIPAMYQSDGTAYWVAGGRMAMEAPPRTKEKLKIEGTFRALAIHFSKNDYPD